ncbi:GtrA family protein [Lactobacillus mulieris]|uniref:GtrA family protein n=1 Tax=Lactobacillus mulieris TaxID=2508708 RepID=A0AAW5WYX6_9LACO|nr:GtrA family protein [Lactobacillus mulieris]MCZ3622588.1 GtrA family protein [Lactobacillus mulieris]MCZ3624226.1 GtrA family protein [Lactobacillus mulieris]MCZ3636595.1 GtrA family protein [Lactobacillus mulieris]MCZ3690344.1 GtrA family protein [Lactobacillus mulieris]MCZ3696313.1 GtrA family protein [Lactobacillus mulieris]
MVRSDRTLLRKQGRKLLRRYRNLYVYMFFGFVAALINTIVFVVLHNNFKVVLVFANTLAFIISNLASFFFNHYAVFTHHVDRSKSIWHKLIAFFTFRIISIVPDTLIMLVGLSVLRWNTVLVKLIDQLLVGIFNYLTTKAVFQKNDHLIRERIRQYVIESKQKNKDH